MGGLLEAGIRQPWGSVKGRDLCHLEQVTEPSELSLLPVHCGDDNVTLLCWFQSHLELGTNVIFHFIQQGTGILELAWGHYI